VADLGLVSGSGARRGAMLSAPTGQVSCTCSQNASSFSRPSSTAWMMSRRRSRGQQRYPSRLMTSAIRRLLCRKQSGTRHLQTLNPKPYKLLLKRLNCAASSKPMNSSIRAEDGRMSALMDPPTGAEHHPGRQKCRMRDSTLMDSPRSAEPGRAPGRGASHSLWWTRRTALHPQQRPE